MGQLIDTVMFVAQWGVFALGCCAIAMAIYFYKVFSASNRHISYAVRAFLAEQVISAVCTIIFAANSLAGTIRGDDSSGWNNIDPSVAIALRAIMFGAMLHATYHLMVEVSRCKEELRNLRNRLSRYEKGEEK